MEGLKLFGVPEQDLTAVTSFRLDIVQRPCFSAQLNRPTARTPSTFGFLLDNAANAIHWPGRGLNSGLASATSLARSLGRGRVWQGRALLDGDFIRHEAAMSIHQYRHKSHVWNAIVATDEAGITRVIKDVVSDSVKPQDDGWAADRSGLELLLARMHAFGSGWRPDCRVCGQRGTARPSRHAQPRDAAHTPGERSVGHPDRPW
ncbi:hypothetical protein [Streptomyces sp. NPDC088847]|uniref:hypothetical protein n=1 Tax=Streptomyces sp. NPDC088847 TaxID=3365909 RepID=UPI0037F51631